VSPFQNKNVGTQVFMSVLK